MGEDLIDHFGVVDAGDGAHCPTAGRARKAKDEIQMAVLAAHGVEDTYVYLQR